MRRHIIAALGLALLTASCSNSGPSPLLKENELMARMLMSDFESGDVSNLSGMFYPTAVYDDYSTQTEYQGLNQISTYVKSLSSWATSLSVTVDQVHVSETGATVEWTLDAVQGRPIPGRISIATGNHVHVNGVTILEISKHRITRAADCMDDLGFMLQLGGDMHMPGGMVLKGTPPTAPGVTGGG